MSRKSQTKMPKIPPLRLSRENSHLPLLTLRQKRIRMRPKRIQSTNPTFLEVKLILKWTLLNREKLMKIFLQNFLNWTKDIIIKFQTSNTPNRSRTITNTKQRNLTGSRYTNLKLSTVTWTLLSSTTSGLFCRESFIDLDQILPSLTKLKKKHSIILRRQNGTKESPKTSWRMLSKRWRMTQVIKLTTEWTIIEWQLNRSIATSIWSIQMWSKETLKCWDISTEKSHYLDAYSMRLIECIQIF